MNDHINWDEIAQSYTVDLNAVSNQPTSHTVVETVAALIGEEPEELDPLWAYIEPDALDAFVSHTDKTSVECRVSFSYEDHVIEVIDNRGLRIKLENEYQPPSV